MLPGVGVFGTSLTTRVIIPLLQSQGFPVKALWGRTPEEAEELAKEMDVPFYTNRIDDVLLHQDVDLVCINLPPPLTRQIAVKTLGIGKNVICDRAATPLDAFRMMSAAHYYPKLMSIMGNVLRFLPAFVKMKQMIQEGYVGDLLICEVQVHSGSLLGKKYNWSCDDLMGGGGLHSVGSYIIDLLTFLTSQKAAKVHGFLKTFVKQTEHIRGIRQITSDDFCTFQMVLEGGVCCTVTLNFNVPGDFKQEIIVVGSTGRLMVNGSDLYGQRNSASQKELILEDSTPAQNFTELEHMTVNTEVYYFYKSPEEGSNGLKTLTLFLFPQMLSDLLSFSSILCFYYDLLFLADKKSSQSQVTGVNLCTWISCVCCHCTKLCTRSAKS
ncbi:glucose-fructose oxidoreductase domain-containing protein 1 isoform X2 [Carcharodon carcharias]|uniref:glucose-fructose oxidoreductase domain-containing protein 1 isoform X2 n=1 Tax=Carcharodon carcharias TaxID=13397 RepID=UPI001B7E4E29|nr:glucose-fructose oxidoreductase domain-containing protein 1 isoform X2 [Carcharodon carcharias]